MERRRNKYNWSIKQWFTSEYKAEIQVYWNPNGGKPWNYCWRPNHLFWNISSGLTSTDDGTGGSPTFGGYFSYQWEQDIGCTGAFTDVTGRILMSISQDQ